MSKQVTVSDIFEEELQELLVAAMRFIKEPSSEHECDYIHARMYEYDTNIQQAIKQAVDTVLTKRY
jgi:hypothetical protein